MTIFRATLLAAVALLLWVSRAQAQEIFTKVADTTMAAPSGNFSSFGIPSIDGGTAAFLGNYNGASGVFTGSGGALTTIVKQGDSGPGSFGTFNDFGGVHTPLSISGGTVAFLGETVSGSSGFFTGSGGALTTIVKSGDAAPSGTFNSVEFVGPSISGGTVAFGDFYGSSGSGIFTGSGGALTTIVTNSAPAPTGTFGNFANPSMSGGTVAFEGFYGSNSQGIFTGSGGPSTTIAKTGDAAPIGTFTTFSTTTSSGPSISAQMVAFLGFFNGNNNSGIFVGSGGALTKIVQSGDAAPIGTFDVTDPYGNGLSISGGTVAFEDSYDGGAYDGIFTSTNGVISPIIKTGDPLFGSTVEYLYMSGSSLDANGDIAFGYTLNNGVSGIAIATPEPASLGLMCLGAAGLLVRRRRSAPR